ncbi:SnoaL-like domain protein [Medicago truncatula]|uniref:SnoaL-like domain protein n=1 Tax=Medicago truncatula TaxID=3880 RepID=G7KC09_MEDTR|nr:SnoaL-like domain protein [Medicago truncatula]
MDVVAKFPTRVSCHYPGIYLDIKKRLTLSFSPRKTTCNLHKKIEIQQRSICVKNVKNGTWDSNRISAILSKRGPKSGKNSMSPAEIVDHFYTCINEKELKQLDEYISQDACFYDYTFINPFQGKKEVMHFLQQLTAGMGQNVKFIVKNICEGDDLTVAAKWHLEWKKEQIPFTTGCSFFQLEKVEENMTIRRAEIFIESLVKPGSIVLTVLKTMTSLFDDFPNAAECELNMVYRFFIDSKSTQKYPLTYMHVPAGFLRRPHIAT